MIDLLRGAFALLVAIAHAYSAAFHHLTKNGDTKSLFGFWSYVVANAGFWVAGFFVISGFCIQLSIRSSLKRGPIDWGHYLLARFTRIYPLTFAGLLGASLAWLILSPGAAFPWSSWLATTLMVQNFAGPFPYYPQSWSLTNESIYYLVWPIFLTAVLYRPRAALFLATVTAASLTTAIVALWKWNAAGQSDHWCVPIWTTSASFVWWLAGAAIHEYWPTLARFVTARRCLSLLPLVLLPCLGAFIAGYAGCRTWVLFLITYLAIPFFGLLILSGRHVSWLATPRGERIATSFGLFSFPLYVIHFQVIALLAHWRAAAKFPISDKLAFSALVLILLVIVCPCCAIVERRLQEWRQLLLAAYRRSRLQAADRIED